MNIQYILCYFASNSILWKNEREAKMVDEQVTTMSQCLTPQALQQVSQCFGFKTCQCMRDSLCKSNEGKMQQNVARYYSPFCAAAMILPLVLQKHCETCYTKKLHCVHIHIIILPLMLDSAMHGTNLQFFLLISGCFSIMSLLPSSPCNFQFLLFTSSHLRIYIIYKFINLGVKEK